MKIILQDNNHAQLLLVSEFTPVAGAFYSDGRGPFVEHDGVIWDRVSFSYNPMARDKVWMSAVKFERPFEFNFDPLSQVVKLDDDFQRVFDQWQALRGVADEELNGRVKRTVIRDEVDTFNCRSALMYCMDRAGMSYSVDDFWSLKGTQFDFSTLENGG